SMTRFGGFFYAYRADMSDLNILFPKPVSASVEGRLVLIKPVQVQHFEAFGRAAGTLLSLMESATPAEVYEYATKSGAMAEILGSCTSLSAWRRKRLPVAVAVELMFQVIKVNSSFFDQALVSAAKALTGAPLSNR